MVEEYTHCPACNSLLELEEGAFFNHILNRYDTFIELFCHDSDCDAYFYCTKLSKTKEVVNITFDIYPFSNRKKPMDILVVFIGEKMGVYYVHSIMELISNEIIDMDFPNLVSFTEKIRLFQTFS